MQFNLLSILIVFHFYTSTITATKLAEVLTVEQKRVKRDCRFMKCRKCCSSTDYKTKNYIADNNSPNLITDNLVHILSTYGNSYSLENFLQTYGTPSRYFPRNSYNLYSSPSSSEQTLHLTSNSLPLSLWHQKANLLTSPCCDLVNKYRQCCACCTNLVCANSCSNHDRVCVLANFCIRYLIQPTEVDLGKQHSQTVVISPDEIVTQSSSLSNNVYERLIASSATIDPESPPDIYSPLEVIHHTVPVPKFLQSPCKIFPPRLLLATPLHKKIRIYELQKLLEERYTSPFYSENSNCI